MPDAQLPWMHHPEEAYQHWLFDAKASGRPRNAASAEVYLAMWAKVCRYMRERKCDVATLRAEDLETFLASGNRYAVHPARELAPVLRPRTRLRYLGVIAEALGAAVELGLRADNPARDLMRAFTAGAPPLPLALSEAQERAFLAALPGGTGWKAVRTRMLLRLILGSGLKPVEALALPMDALRLDEVPAHVLVAPRGKAPARAAPLSSDGLAALHEWLGVRSRLPDAGELVFPGTATGAPLSAATLYRAMAEACAAAGIDKPHTGALLLRNTFAVRQLAQDTPLEDVQAWLGHRQARSTARLKALLPAGRRQPA